MLLLVKWKDGSMNTVFSEDLEYDKTKNLSSGLNVKMYWPAEKKILLWDYNTNTKGI